ncbi:MAG: putative Ig domain-containing protein [Bacteroidetes bacterium]|nr:putative Ig domain-containing protein [Fibrella sp.]
MALSLVTPGFDCATGKLTLRSRGGDGSPIEYMTLGLRSWSRDSVFLVDPWQREGVTFTLQARQSGKEVTTQFRTSCPSTPANKPPVVVTPIASQTATLARAYSFVIPAGTFSDPDGELVKWSVENLPVGLTFEAGTRTISGTPSLIGPNVVTITVTDNGGASVSTTFILQVLGNNTTPTPPPTPTPIPSTLTLLAPGFDCATGKLTFRSVGGDGTPVEYFAVGIKSWSRDSVGYVDPWQREGVTFTLQVRQSGRQVSYSFLTACSSAPANKPPVNKAPVVVTPVANQTATLARAYSFVIPAGTFNDPDGELVKWSAENLPAGLTFEAATRTISGTASVVGPKTVTITVTDNGSESVSTTFTLQVLGDNTTPTPPPTPTPTPTPGTLALLAPGFDCATGRLTFRSSGGDGTPVEYMALGIKGWSRDSAGFVETHQRSGVTFTLKARQSGREVSYSFTTACGGITPPTSPAPTPAPIVSALAVASPQNRIVYQRNQANQANVPVVGQAPGTATRAEARLVPVVNGQGASMDWTNLPLSTAKTFSTNLTHTGGWYRLEVRAWNEGTQLGQQTIDRVGIGEVFVIAGQSNAYGGFEVRPGASDDRVSCLDYKDDNLNEALLPVRFSHADISVSVGPSNPKHIWAELGDKLTNRLNVPVLFLGAAESSTSSDVWRQSAENGANFAPDYFPYRRLGAALLHYTARTGIRAILWHQGEGDQGRSTQSYVDNLMVVINKSRQQSGNGSLPWVMSRATYVRGLTDPNIIGAQNRLINEMPHVYPGPETDALGAESRLPDNVHIAGSGAVRFVELWDRSLNTDFFNRSAPLSLGSFPQITTGYTLASNRAAGQPISVPYVVSGNPSATSQFSVQLIRDSDGSVVTTLGSGRENPMTVTLPGNLANGVYRAKVISDNLTSLAGEPFRVGSASGRIASPETQAATWQVWPNPVEREVTIAIPAILTAAKLRGVLSTADGVNKSDAIESTRVENGQLHLTLSSLQTGLYFLRIYEGDQPLQTLKVFKK